MNKKAFTLIELLAVVSILAILALIITPAIDNNIKKSKQKALQVQIENIRMAAEAYYADNISEKPAEGMDDTIYVSELVTSGYLSNNVKNPETGTIFSSNTYVKLENINGKYVYTVCPLEEECD